MASRRVAPRRTALITPDHITVHRLALHAVRALAAQSSETRPESSPRKFQTLPPRIGRRPPPPTSFPPLRPPRLQARLGSFTSQDFDVFLRGFCADASSPQISAILVGHSTCENDSLRKCPQLSAKLPQKPRRKITKSWFAKFPRPRHA